MSKRERAEFMIRLNLKNEEDLRVWEKLQTRGELSYKQMFVKALLAGENPQSLPDRDDLRRMIREEVGSAIREELNRLPAGTVVQPMTNETEASDPESMEEARDFMKIMGF